MLPGIRPEEIETIPDKDKKLEAYRVVFKSLFDGFDFRQKVRLENDRQHKQEVQQLRDTISSLQWELNRES